MWGQFTLTISSLSPKRDWGPKRVNALDRPCTAAAHVRVVFHTDRFEIVIVLIASWPKHRSWEVRPSQPSIHETDHLQITDRLLTDHWQIPTSFRFVSFLRLTGLSRSVVPFRCSVSLLRFVVAFRSVPFPFCLVPFRPVSFCVVFMFRDGTGVFRPSPLQRERDPHRGQSPTFV